MLNLDFVKVKIIKQSYNFCVISNPTMHMTTLEIRQQIEEYIDCLSSEGLKVTGKQDIAKGNLTNWRSIRDDV